MAEKKSPILERGKPGYRYTGNKITDELHRDLRGSKLLTSMREMRDNDPIVGSFMLTVESLISNNDVNVQAADDSDMAEVCRNHVDECLHDMSMSLADVIQDALSMCWAGYAIQEKIYKIRAGSTTLPETNSKYSDGLYGIRALAPRVQDTVWEWEILSDGTVSAFIQKAPPENKPVRIPLSECVHYKTTGARAIPTGRSLLRNAYVSYWYVKRMREYEAIGVEKDMAGVPIATVPVEYLLDSADSSQQAFVAELRKNLERMRRGEQEHIIFPAEVDDEGNPTGFKIYLMQSGGRRPVDSDTIIKRHESRIAISFLGESVLLGQQGNVGSWSLHSGQTSLMAMAMGGIQNMIASAWNTQLVPELCTLNNWPVELAPTVTFADLETDDMQSLLSALSSATGGQALIEADDAIEDYIRERTGLPPRVESPRISNGQIEDAIGALRERELGLG